MILQCKMTKRSAWIQITLMRKHMKIEALCVWLMQLRNYKWNHNSILKTGTIQNRSIADKVVVSNECSRVQEACFDTVAVPHFTISLVQLHGF